MDTRKITRAAVYGVRARRINLGWPLTTDGGRATRTVIVVITGYRPYNSKKMTFGLGFLHASSLDDNPLICALRVLEIG